MKPEPPLKELMFDLRIEVARVTNGSAGWWMLDWVHDDGPHDPLKELSRLVARFRRIVLSLERQTGGTRAKNEPYHDVIGVRCRMGTRVLGIWPLGPYQRALTTAPTAPASEDPLLREYESWRARALQKSRVSRPQSKPPPCRDNRSDSKASKDE